MSLTVCIPDLIEQGKIPPERQQEVSSLYDRLLAEKLASGMDRPTAETMATNMALQLLKREAMRKKANLLKQHQRQQAWLDDMRIRSGDGKAIQFKPAIDRMVEIDKKIDTVRGRFFATLGDFLKNHRRNLMGELRNKEDLQQVGRALFGELVDDLNAREISDAIARVFEVARKRFNQAGGDIGKLKEGYIPQRHDSRAIRAAGFEQWRAHPSIESVKVRDLETGEWATGPKRETLLRDIYESLRTEGANKMNPGQVFGGAMANRRGDPRILHFDGYDNWIAYQRDFGGGEDVYDTIVSHLSMMARDIAMMEEMGPNPAAMLRFQQGWLEKSARIDGDQADIDGKFMRGKSIAGKREGLQNYYDELTGANRIPHNRPLALGFSAIRSVQTASKLGSAVLSAVADFATLLRTAAFNDVPVMKTMGRYLSLWTNGQDRELAVRLGLVTDDFINMNASSSRYLGEELQGELSRRLAQFVIRGQGLARHTRNGQWAFGMEFLNHLSMMRDRSFANLDPALQRQMRRHGIGDVDWDNYRTTKTQTQKGTEWIFPSDNQEVGEKFLQMVLTETDYAVIVPDLRTRTQIGSMLRPGTFVGEIGRSAFLFKAFPMAILNLHGRRMIEQSSLKGMAGYIVPLMLGLTAMGALGAQLKMLAAGKDPQPMDDPKFFGKAIIQGGGLGLFGDLLYNSQNSYGGGVQNTLLGPLIGQTIPNLWDATAGNVTRALDGDDSTEAEFGKDIALTLEKEMPLRNLWYSRLIWERTITDSIRELVDPDYAKAFDRMEKRAEKEGTAYFARPGEGLSDIRLPDFDNGGGQ